MNTRLLAASALCVALAGSTVLGQIAPPPTPTPAPTPKFVPQKPKPRPTTNRAKAKKKKIDTLPDLPFEKLAVHGEDGRILPLKEQVSLAAMKHNPTIQDVTANKIMPIVLERRARNVKVVLENLDVIEELDHGLIDTVSVQDMETLTRVTKIIELLTPQGTLVQELKGRKVLSRIQAGINDKIVQDYWKDISAQADAEHPGDPIGGAIEMTKMMFKDQVFEVMQIYNQLNLLVGQHPAEVVAGIELTGEQQAAMADARNKLEGELPDDERIATAKAYLKPLTIDQKRVVLQKAFELRPMDPMPEPIEVKPNVGQSLRPKGNKKPE
jgi:hypothetical protein